MLVNRGQEVSERRCAKTVLDARGRREPYMPMTKTYAPNRIEELRRAAGLTLTQLAEKVEQVSGVKTSHQQMQRLEKRQRRLTADWAQRIAAALDVEPGDLMLSTEAAKGYDYQKPPGPTANKETARLILAARRQADLSQRDLAARLGVSASAVAQWETGETKPSAKLFGDIERILNLRLGDAFERKTHDFEPVSVPQPHKMTRNLPVLGIGACYNERQFGGVFDLNGTIVDRVTMPPALEGVPGAYAIYAVGTSMEPRYHEGELLYVHPQRPPGVGDYVVVQLHPAAEGEPDRAMVKRLVRPWRPGSTSPLVLEQYSPAETFKVPAEQVKALHKILNGTELFYG